MTPRPWLVVTAWLGGNAVLIALLFGFDEWVLAEMLYVVATLPLIVLALLTRRSEKRVADAEEQWVRDIGATGAPAVLGALGALLTGLGLIFAQWLAIVGVVIMIVAGIAAARATAAARPLMRTRVDLLPAVSPAPRQAVPAPATDRLRPIALAAVAVLVGVRRKTVRR